MTTPFKDSYRKPATVDDEKSDSDRSREAILTKRPFLPMNLREITMMAPEQSRASKMLSQALDLTCHMVILFSVRSFQVAMDWIPNWIGPFKEFVLSAIVWVAFIVRFCQNVAEVLLFSMDLYYTLLLFVGLFGYMLVYQPYLVIKEFIAAEHSPSSEFVESVADLDCDPLEWRRRIHAVQYARAMYEHSAAGILFAYGALLTPNSLLGMLQDLISSFLETMSLGSLVRKTFLEKELPGKWQTACEHIETFEPKLGFARFTLPKAQQHKLYNFMGLFPPTTPQFSPIFTPLCALYKDYVFDETKRAVLVLVVRGSTSLRDWLVDANCWTSGCHDTYVLRRDANQPSKSFDTAPGDQVHIGIYAASVDLFLATSPRVRDELVLGDVDELVITGHSLGGAVTVYLTEMYRKNFADIENLKITGYAFAPPGCHSKQPKGLETFRYKNDLVTRLSLGGFEQFILDLTMQVEKMLDLKKGEYKERIVREQSMGCSVTLGKTNENFIWDVSLLSQVECHAPWNYDNALRCIVAHYQVYREE